MSIMIMPEQVTVRLAAADAPVELWAADGRVLGYFTPAKGKGPYRVDPPATAAELDRRQARGTGRPLADILRDLEGRS